MNKLIRSRNHRMIAGVCGGLGEYFRVDPTIIRVLYVLISVFTIAFPGIFVYILLWIIIPEEEKGGRVI